jgi:asparagine synthetase B (glutamine-hydrolysing)
MIVQRDEFGFIPMIYYTNGSTFAVSSSPNWLFDHLNFRFQPNRESLRAFLLHSASARRDDFITPVRRILPGEYAVVSPRMSVRLCRYYFRDQAQAEEWAEFDHEAAILQKRITELVESYADHPIAYMMSGGLDSTTLVGLHARLREREQLSNDSIATASLVSRRSGFPDETDLLDHMYRAFSLESVEYERDEGFALFDDTLLEETGGFGPQWHPGTIAEGQFLDFIVQALGRRRVVTGIGADRLFKSDPNRAAMALLKEGSLSKGGEALCRTWHVRRLVSYPLRRLVGGRLQPETKWMLKRNLPGLRERPWLWPRLWTRNSQPIETYTSLGKHLSNGLPEELSWPWEYFIRECRRKAVLSGVEYMFPYLSVPFVERYSQLPHQYAYRDGFNKAILRRAVSEVLPKAIVQAPKRLWLGRITESVVQQNSEQILSWFDEPRLADLGLLEPGVFKQAFRTFLRAKATTTEELGFRRMWRTIAAEKWLRDMFP